jgi:hypothetical protein
MDKLRHTLYSKCKNFVRKGIVLNIQKEKTKELKTRQKKVMAQSTDCLETCS